MQYITGHHALCCPCALNTPGNPHHLSVDWTYPATADTDTAFFKDYGIEKDRIVPIDSTPRNVANHLRAVLDLLAEGKLKELVGLKHEIIANDLYTPELFNKVIELNSQSALN